MVELHPHDPIEIVHDGAMSVSAAVAWTGVGRSKLYEAMSRGHLRFLKDGKRRLIPRRALREYLAQRLVDNCPSGDPRTVNRD